LPYVYSIGRLPLIKLDWMKSSPKTPPSPTLNAIAQEEENNYQRNGQNKGRCLSYKFVGHRCKLQRARLLRQKTIVWCRSFRNILL